LTYYCTSYYLIKYHIVYIDENTVKYKLNKRDIEYFEKYSKITDPKYNDIFYTKTPWSTSTFNYLIYKDNYYIVEPGYYYHYKKGVKLNCKDIFVLNKNKS
jgi:hypothetical protein